MIMRKNQKIFTIGVSWLLLVILAGAIPIWSAPGVETEVLADFDVVEADLRDVFRSLAEIGDINVLLDPSVKGVATIKLKHGLTIKEAMEMLAQTYGYSYRWITASRTILIGNEKTFTQFETKETKIYALNYAQTDQVVESLKIAVPSDQIGIDKRTNQLTIRASLLEHQNIEELIERLDREMPQINIEARVEELTKEASEDLGVLWSFGQTDNDIDFRVTTTATLSALESENKARLLARPNISTVDGQEGKIFIGERYPVVTTKQTSDGLETQITYVEFGTSLKVVPRLNEDNVVTVLVQAYVSSDKRWIPLNDGNEIPLVSTREASSVVRLREGETFILSGLNLSKDSLGDSGTPGLRKVPVLGRLFGTKSSREEETEIVIFLTPKVVELSSSQRETAISSNLQSGAASARPLEATTQSTAVDDALGYDQEGVELRGEAAQTLPSPNDEAVDGETTVNEPIPSPPENPPVDSSITSGAAGSFAKPTPEAAVSSPSGRGPVDGTNASPGYKVKYIVKQGDTALSIATKYGVTSESIRQANQFEANKVLPVGLDIVIPIPEDHRYILKPKETIWRLAKRHGTSVEILMEINNFTDYTKIEAGQQIILPVPTDRIIDSRF